MRPLIILCFSLLLLTACHGKLSGLASKTGSVCISTLSGDNKKVVSAAENEATDENNAHEVSTAALVTGWESRISIW